MIKYLYQAAMFIYDLECTTKISENFINRAIKANLCFRYLYFTVSFYSLQKKYKMLSSFIDSSFLLVFSLLQRYFLYPALLKNITKTIII